MPTVKLSDELVSKARINAKVYHRSVPMQIEYWAMIGRALEENPGMTFDKLIKKTLWNEQLTKQQTNN